jgi:uncharacterized protein YecE (DUF72 family)
MPESRRREPMPGVSLPLFGEDEATVQPATPTADVMQVAHALHTRHAGRLHLGTSSWHFPGWRGWVWGHAYRDDVLSRHGLPAYAAHPLLRCVSLDRAFYRPLDATAYAALAAQVPAHFRFVAKAPALVSDAMLRDAGNGAPLQPNPLFLDPAAAVNACARPAAEGLGDKLGAIVVQLSPLPARWLGAPAELLDRLDAMLSAMVPQLPATALLAVEPRDAALLTPDLAEVLRRHGARACLGLHDKLPPIDALLPLQRALWPGDLVCRWNLQRGQRYAQARDAWAPFDRLQSPDPATRRTLATVARATLNAGHRVFITINNKAEGNAPASVLELAREMLKG